MARLILNIIKAFIFFGIFYEAKKQDSNRLATNSTRQSSSKMHGGTSIHQKSRKKGKAGKKADKKVAATSEKKDDEATAATSTVSEAPTTAGVPDDVVPGEAPVMTTTSEASPSTEATTGEEAISA